MCARMKWRLLFFRVILRKSCWSVRKTIGQVSSHDIFKDWESRVVQWNPNFNEKFWIFETIQTINKWRHVYFLHLLQKAFSYVRQVRKKPSKDEVYDKWESISFFLTPNSWERGQIIRLIIGETI